MPVFLNTTDADFETAFTALLSAKREDSPDVDDTVAGIIADVRTSGDTAVLELTSKFDRLDLTATTMRVSADEIEAECAKVSEVERQALETAAERIRAYHARQVPEDAMWTDPDGATLGWRWTAVSAAGLYVPGGLASYPSSVLMNAVPAKVAGVGRLVVTVPTPDGIINPLVMMAGDCRAGIRDRDDRAGRQDHRAGQCLCRRRQTPCVRKGRDRHDRGTVRDSRDRRPRQRSGLSGPRPDEPS